MIIFRLLLPQLELIVGKITPLDSDLPHQIRVAHVRIILLPLVPALLAVQKEGALRFHRLLQRRLLLIDARSFHL